MAYQTTFSIPTAGRSLIDITAEVGRALRDAPETPGLCHVFIHHTSASLLITENASPEVLVDLENFYSRLVPDGDPRYLHDEEGPDDMPGHIRSALTTTSLSIPWSGQRLLLGTWQGIFLWEHRHSPHQRRITLTVVT